jgi:hypothetical protein
MVRLVRIAQEVARYVRERPNHCGSDLARAILAAADGPLRSRDVHYCATLAGSMLTRGAMDRGLLSLEKWGEARRADGRNLYPARWVRT